MVLCLIRHPPTTLALTGPQPCHVLYCIMWFIGYGSRCQSDELGPGDFPMEFGSLIEGALTCIAVVIHISLGRGRWQRSHSETVGLYTAHISFRDRWQRTSHSETAVDFLAV